MNQSFNNLNKNLINKMLEDDNSSVIEFIKLIEPLTWGVLYKYDQLSEDDREDLFQEIILKLFSKNKKRIRMWEGKSKFSTFLYKMAVNTILDYLKSAGYNKSKNNESIDNIVNTSHYTDFADIYSLKQAIKSLKENEKQVIELFYFNQMKEKEIAEYLNKSINTISSIKFRAIKKLKQFLEEN
jgi:RNA polymerase sigma factor (sigma-70 family)